MDPARWERIQTLFHGALDVPEGERDAWLDRACPDDPDLASEVRALLSEDGSAGTLLDRGFAEVADAVLDGDADLPDRVGPYRLVRPLGEGGMGVVHLASRDDLDRTVAIKFLRDARLSPERRRRFVREQRFLSRLLHPSICRLYDAGTLADGTPYFVMEHVDGVPLNAHCDRRGLALGPRLELFREACEAVRYAHRRAVIHRDLKPSNILAVADPGSGPQVKLLDFGIARAIDRDGTDATVTRTGVSMMTPAYAAPEQLHGREVGVATDVYALGVLLYELLTGSLPFDLSGSTPVEAARIVGTGDPERPSSRGFALDVPRRARTDLDVLCLTAMHRDPERRYATVEALVRDLDHFLAGEPLEARGEGVVDRTRKFVRRHRRAVAVWTVVATVAVAMAAFHNRRLRVARDAAVAEAQRAQRIQRFMLDLFEGGDDVAGPERGLTVTTLIDRGVRQARALDGDPAMQAELYRTLGGVYHRMADLERADALLRQALADRRAIHGEDHPDVAETLAALGRVTADRGDLDAALDMTREAVAIVEARWSDGHPRVAEARNALGDVLVQRGDYEEAIELLESVVRSHERRDDASGLGESLQSLADAHFYAGDYETSSAINRRLLELLEDRFGAGHPAYASCLISLAAGRRWLGYLDEAEDLYRRALAINEAYHGPGHPTVASNLSLLGGILTDLERYDEAREHVDEALAIHEEVFGPEHVRVALTLNQRARSALAAGDLDGAEADFRRELAIYRRIRGEDHPWTAAGLSNLASVHFRKGRYDLAERAMRSSLDTFRAALDPDHVDVAIARIKLGRLLAALERPREAESELTAGLAVLTARANPSLSWIRHAREELVAVYEALGEDARAEATRALLDP